MLIVGMLILKMMFLVFLRVFWYDLKDCFLVIRLLGWLVGVVLVML